MNPAATFDALSIGVQLGRALGSAGRSEIHLFAYLACLLALYETKPVTEWEYSFAGTQDGSPFSADLNCSIETLIRAGSLVGDAAGVDFYAVSESGLEEYGALKEIPSFGRRERYLEGACASLLSIPVGRVRMGLRTEPSMARVAPGLPARPLLEGVAFDELYAQLRALSDTLGAVATDLLVPAVVWLSYLAKQAEQPIGGIFSERSGPAATEAHK